MAKKRAKNPKRKKPETLPREPSLSPETRKGVGVVFLLALGVISLLSLFELAGSAGHFIENVLKIFLGQAEFLFPLILIILAGIYLRPKYTIKGINWLGLGLFVLSFLGLLHLRLPLEEAFSALGQGRGGGYLGLALALPLRKLMGFWATLITLVAFLTVSILIMFNTTLEHLSQKSRVITRLVEKIKLSWDRLNFFLRSEAEKPKEEEEITPPEELPSFGAKVIEGPKEKERALGEQLALPHIPEPPKAKPTKIDLPLDLLNGKPQKPTSGDIRANMSIIQKTLENFGIPVEMGVVQVGPTVTQYTLRPSEGIKLSQITTLHNDLALALAAHPIRIEAPIPGKSLVGVEVPNQKVAIVSLKELLSSEEFKLRKSNLMVALGKDVAGSVWLADLDKMPHLLIAGATGSGKTVAINSLIISLLYQNSPQDLKFILVDPKRVELPLYDGIPHLASPVITQVDKTINALRWTIGEMERRFELLSKMGKRNIQTYNREAPEKMPYLVFIIDELADLMVASRAEVEACIIRLAQMARAVGIHLVVSTQRPSVDVITGLIKANITSRIAFAVASLVDSRTILDTSGAEKLLGRGDMLYISAELSKPKRLQGAYLADEEIKRTVDYLKSKGIPEYLGEITQRQTAGPVLDFGPDDEDELLTEAKKVILQAGKASASLLQRRLRVGYARAARLLDLLEEQGFIGPADGAKPREVLIPQEESDNIEKEKVREERN